jgi:hypothetical protein
MDWMRKTLWIVMGLVIPLMLTAGPAHAQKKTLVVALNQDPDILDPTLSRTYVGRIVFSQICEKLYEIDEQLAIHPQLAADMPAVSDGGRTVTIKLRPNVKFNDGTPMNAEAVKFSLDRHRTMKGSNRRSELASVEAVEVVDPLAVRLRLKGASSPLLAQLTDRAGMPVSPAAVNKLGDKFGTAPVCVGPWQFAERVPQDRIVVEKSPHYFDPGQAKFDKIIFRIIADDNVRLANLRSGDIDVMHQVSPTDATAIKREGRAFPIVVTDFNKASVQTVLDIEPDAKPGSYRLVVGAGDRPMTSEEVKYVYFQGTKNAQGKFDRLRFAEIFLMKGRWADYTLLPGEISPYLNRLVLAGRYQDEQGRGWEFSESGEARWPDQKFVYDLSLNDPGAGCEYLQTEDIKEGAGNKRFGYAWKNGKLSIYPARMVNKKVRCDAKPLAVLTPQ